MLVQEERGGCFLCKLYVERKKRKWNFGHL